MWADVGGIARANRPVISRLRSRWSFLTSDE